MPLNFNTKKEDILGMTEYILLLTPVNNSKLNYRLTIYCTQITRGKTGRFSDHILPSSWKPVKLYELSFCAPCIATYNVSLKTTTLHLK